MGCLSVRGRARDVTIAVAHHIQTPHQVTQPIPFQFVWITPGFDVERDQLALTEHILEKLKGGGGPEPDQAVMGADTTVDRADSGRGGQAPDQAHAKASEEQPIMMLGAP